MKLKYMSHFKDAGKCSIHSFAQRITWHLLQNFKFAWVNIDQKAKISAVPGQELPNSHFPTMADFKIFEVFVVGAGLFLFINIFATLRRF